MIGLLILALLLAIVLSEATALTQFTPIPICVNIFGFPPPYTGMTYRKFSMLTQGNALNYNEYFVGYSNGEVQCVALTAVPSASSPSAADVVILRMNNGEWQRATPVWSMMSIPNQFGEEKKRLAIPMYKNDLRLKLNPDGHVILEVRATPDPLIGTTTRPDLTYNTKTFTGTSNKIDTNYAVDYTNTMSYFFKVHAECAIRTLIKPDDVSLFEFSYSFEGSDLNYKFVIQDKDNILFQYKNKWNNVISTKFATGRLPDDFIDVTKPTIIDFYCVQSIENTQMVAIVFINGTKLTLWGNAEGSGDGSGFGQITIKSVSTRSANSIVNSVSLSTIQHKYMPYLTVSGDGIWSGVMWSLFSTWVATEPRSKTENYCNWKPMLNLVENHGKGKDGTYYEFIEESTCNQA